MREYIREQGLKYRYFPPFIILRICFITLVFAVGQLQWLFVIASCPFSYGFLYDTEAEHMLPLGREELIARRRLRVAMVWLRYLIICLASIAVHYVMIKNGNFSLDSPGSALLRRPLIPAFYFVLQMLFVYNTLLTASVTQKPGKKKKLPIAKALERFVFYLIPAYVYFIYGAGFCINGFIYHGSQWIHISIIVVATVLLSIHNIKETKNFTIPDFSLSIQKAQV